MCQGMPLVGILLLVTLGGEHLLDLVLDGAVLGLVSNALQHPDGVGEASLGQVPAGRLGHEADADPQGDGWDGAQHEHPSPRRTVARGDDEVVEEGMVGRLVEWATLGGLQAKNLVPGMWARGDAERIGIAIAPHRDLRPPVGGVDDGVHGEGQQLAGDDHELVDGHDRSANTLGRALGEIYRHGGRGGTDGESQDEAEEVDHAHGGSERRPQGPEQEDDGKGGDVVTPPPPIGHRSPDHGADGRSDEQDSTDRPLLDGGESQPAGGTGHVHVGQGARDDTGVVAEEQGAQGGDGGNGTDSAVWTRGRGVADQSCGLIRTVRQCAHRRPSVVIVPVQYWDWRAQRCARCSPTAPHAGQ